MKKQILLALAALSMTAPAFAAPAHDLDLLGTNLMITSVGLAGTTLGALGLSMMVAGCLHESGYYPYAGFSSRSQSEYIALGAFTACGGLAVIGFACQLAALANS